MRPIRNTPADASNNVGAPFHTGNMAHQTAQDTFVNQDGKEITCEYHVSYSDSDTGRTKVEVFADLAAAERFANIQLRDPDSWAIVERVELHGHLRLVA